MLFDDRGLSLPKMHRDRAELVSHAPTSGMDFTAMDPGIVRKPIDATVSS
jgi:hypothetical protein